MPDKFQLFRLSLVQRNQIEFFPEPNIDNREEYLRYIFTQSWEYEHRGKNFHYRPSPTLSISAGLMGRFGRQVRDKENAPPDEGFEDILHDGWKAAVIALDPTDHWDGQKIAVQIDPKVGAPGAILESFIEGIQRLHPMAPFVIKAVPLFDVETLWQFVVENDYQITSVTFDFVVPNGMWTSMQDLDDELRVLRNDTRAQKVSTTYKTTDSLEIHSDQIKIGVNYAARGSGKVKATAKNGKRFYSVNKPIKTTLHTYKNEQESLIARAARHITKVLGQ